MRKVYRTKTVEHFPAHMDLVINGRSVRFAKVVWDSDGKEFGLRYGTNPDQPAAMYLTQGQATIFSGMQWLQIGEKTPSLTNLQDGHRGLRLLSRFTLRDSRNTAVACMKHLNACGVAEKSYGNQPVVDVYRAARDSDRRAAYGGVAVFNCTVDEDAAREIATTFVDVVYAPSYSPEAIALLKTKPIMRVAAVPQIGTPGFNKSLFRSSPVIHVEDGIFTIEEPPRTALTIDGIRKLPVVTARKPTEAEYSELLRAWWTVSETRSNGVVFWKDDATIAVSTGGQDRIGAIEDGIAKAERNEKINGRKIDGSVVGSDGFPPKNDNIDALAAVGVRAIIHPGGSQNDEKVVAACNQHDIAMVYTQVRRFAHF